MPYSFQTTSEEEAYYNCPCWFPFWDFIRNLHPRGYFHSYYQHGNVHVITFREIQEDGRTLQFSATA